MAPLPEDLLPFYEGDHESVADQTTSKKGKVSPPSLVGILADGQYVVREYELKDEFGSNYTKGEDILDYLIKTLTNVSVIKRVGEEFCAEAKIKLGEFTKLVVEWQSIGRSNEHPVSMFFHASDITYGSWSLSALVRDALADAGYESPQNVVSCYALIMYVVIPGYTQRHLKKLNKPDKIKEVLKKMASLYQLMQQAMWDWNEEKKVFELGTCPEKYKAYKNNDSNTVSNAKGERTFGFRYNLLVIKLAKLEKKTPVQVMGEFTRGVLVQVPELKEVKRKEVVSRGTMLILHPTIIEEITFRRMVKGIQDEVFSDVKDWGKVTLKKEVTVGKRLASAICLLQLGIGSRVLGIIAVNKIEALESIETKATEDTKLDRDATFILQDIRTGLRVGRITKNKNEDLQTINMFNSRARFDEGFTEEKAREIIKGEREAFVIDKPVQYYFFDQNTVKKEATGPVSEPREVFLQLLKVVRECVKHISEKGLLTQEANWVSKNPGQKNKMPRVQWELYTSAERKIFMVKETDTASAAMTQLFNSVYNVVKKKCVSWLKTIPNLQDTTTHMLRRMYVCYSYQFFGRGRLKEIGYAQYVLRHKSIESSIFYTTMQFNMALDGRLGVDEERYNEAIEQIENAKGQLAEMKDDVERQLKRLREKSDEVKTVLDMGPRKRLKREVELKKVDGTSVMYTKKPREVRKSSREVKVANGVTEAKKLRDDGFLMTRVNLTKAGINADIVRDVLDKVLLVV
jgi:hypothetical protein